MPRQPISFTVGAYPWIEATDTGVTPSVLYRSYLVLPYNLTSEVTCEETKDPLPFVGQWFDSKGNRWSKYELPRGGSSDSQTLVRFGNEDGAQNTISVCLGTGIARSTLDEVLDEEDSPADAHKFYAGLKSFIDQHIQFMNDLNDFKRRNRLYWDGNCAELQIRSVHRAVLRWSKSESKDNAKLALIVKLARDIAKPLGQICESPRVVLRRTREMQNIGRIQEIDPACLRWIARQPGRDIYERAGIVLAAGKCLRQPEHVSLFIESFMRQLGYGGSTQTWWRALSEVLRFRGSALQNVCSKDCMQLLTRAGQVFEYQRVRGEGGETFRLACLVIVYALRRRAFDDSFLDPSSELAEKLKGSFRQARLDAKENRIRLIGGSVNLAEQLQLIIDYVDRRGKGQLLIGD